MNEEYQRPLTSEQIPDPCRYFGLFQHLSLAILENLYECIVCEPHALKALSNSYRPLFTSVTKTLLFFDYKVNGSFERRRVGAASNRTPPNVENHTFLVSPLVDNERNDLRRGPRRGPTETEPPEVEGGFESMKE